MPFLTKINAPGTTTLTKFAGDTMNRLADWSNNIDVASGDVSKRPIINTQTIFQQSKLALYDSDDSNVFQFSTAANLVADKTINIPTFAASSDDMVLATAVQTLTGKIIDANSNTISNVVISSKANLPATVVFNDQNNSLGAFYFDLLEIAAPTAPASGRRRIYVDSTTHKISSRTSAATTVSLEEGQTGTWDPNSVETLTNKSMSGAANTFTLIPDTALSANVSKNGTAQTVSAVKTHDNYIDMKAVTEPVAPSSTYMRFYVRATDANNDELVVWLKKAGAYVKVVVA